MEKFNNKNGKLLVVQIPTYNEEKNISEVIKRIPREITGINEVKVLVTDDCSKDNTVKVAKDAGADFIVKSSKNTGLGRNFKRGIEACLKIGADIVVNIDGDGQFNPEDIPKIIAPILNDEADMVTASRFINPELTKNMPWIKKWGNKRYAKLITRITGENFSDVSCGFRAYSREALLRLNLHGTFTYTQEVFIDLVEKGLKIKEIPLEVKYFEGRKSIVSGSLRRYGFKSLGIIAKTTRDTQPMTFFGAPGLILFFLGGVGGIFSLAYWLVYHETTPIRTLFSVSVFFITFGISLIILALVADMLKTMKINQEEVLYRLKKAEYDKR